jgi:DNA repair protein RadA/Sms
MVLAVLEAHCGVKLGQYDVYLNVAGGYRIVEPAADLAVAAALLSSLCGVPLPADSVHFGEISLSGSTRPVAHANQRLKEASKLGFHQASASTASDDVSNGGGMKVDYIKELTELAVKISSMKEKT